MTDLLIVLVFLTLATAFAMSRIDRFENQYSGKLKNLALLKVMIFGAILGIVILILFILVSDLASNILPSYVGWCIGGLLFIGWMMAVNKLGKIYSGK